MAEKSITITVDGAPIEICNAHASFLAESLLAGECIWQAAAVNSSRRNMRHKDAIVGYTGDFQAADVARTISRSHIELAVALLHAADDENSHYRCNPTTCEKARIQDKRLGTHKPLDH
jgi:hypothetical protein